MVDYVHHIVHFVMYSLFIWQVVLGLYVILIWASKNFKFHRSPVLNIGESFKSDSRGKSLALTPRIQPRSA